MENCVTREEFDALREKVEWLSNQNNDTKVWEAKYGERIDAIYDKVNDLYNNPKKRWDSVVAAFIASFITAIVAFGFAKIFGA